MNRDLILDCQFGSTGKGLFASHLAARKSPDTIAYAPSPNAGHTFYYEGKQYIHKMLPSGISSASLKTIVLGPGSLLDLDRLLAEILNLPYKVDVFVHRNAAIVLDRHRAAEANGGTAPGSTRTGVGAAQANRILRQPDLNNLVGENQDHQVFDYIQVVDTPEMQRIYANSQQLLIESCQGYSLSVLHGFYPYCTSRDVTTASILADCGVPYSHRLTVYGTFRTYPIRVANRPESGEYSGPSFIDGPETSFEAIGQPIELTTVTKLPRRIFKWSQQQALEACAQNHVDVAFLNFAQYCTSFDELVHIWESLGESTQVGFLGFGPKSEDVLRVGAPAISRDQAYGAWRRYRDSAGGNCSLG